MRRPARASPAFARAAAQRGLTLLESVATIAIVSVIAASGVAVLGIAVESQITATGFAEVTDVGTITSNWLYTELREMQIPASVGLSTMGASDIQFTDWSGRTLRYTLSGSRITRSLNGGAAQTFASDVSSFQIIYRRVNGTVAATAAQVARIDFAITLERGGVVRRYGGQVWPRSTAPYIANWREQ